MTYFPNITIKNFADSTNLDGFGRLKVSNPYTQFDAKQISGNPLDAILFVSKSVSNASASYSSNRASTTISVVATSGSRYIRQSRKRMNYQPGKGLTIIETFVFGTGSTGIIKRIGYFDDNNGIFFEQSASNINMVLRSSVTGVPVETRVSQSAWSTNKFDGANPAVYAFDPTKAQIFNMDIQWLGTGRVRTGFFQSGSLYTAHEFSNAGQTSTYMSTPNLPVRMEIENYTNTSANSMELICAGVQTDAGNETAGFQRAADRSTSTKTIVTGAFKPVLSIKLTSGSNQIVIPTSFSFYCTTADIFKWAVLLNPTYSSTDSPAWQTVTSSCVQYDITRDGTVAGGIVIDSGYGTGGGSNAARVVSDTAINSSLVLGATVDGVSDEIVLAVQPLTTLNMLAHINWNED